MHVYKECNIKDITLIISVYSIICLETVQNKDVKERVSSSVTYHYY